MVPIGGWYESYVNYLAARVIVNGDDIGKFSPDASVTRQDIATIISRYVDKAGYDAPKAKALGFDDNGSIADYAAPAISILQQIGIIDGKPGNVFDPKGFGTRAQSAKMMAELLKYFMQ